MRDQPHPPSRAPHAARMLAWIACLGLVATVAVGAWLRWWLAGVPLPVHDYGAIRHLHTHLGYYAVLFPLMWLGWAGLGVPTPGRRLLLAYVAVVLLSAAGFAHRGYGPAAIAGSTGVLGIWLVSAWRARGLIRPKAGWLATVPLGIVLGAGIVPQVAIHAGTPQAAEAVRSFLGMLLLVSLVPTALARGRAWPFPGLGWFVVAVVAALSLGVLTVPAARAGLLVVGLLVGFAGLSARVPVDVRAAWAVAGAGLAATGAGLLELDGPVAVAGTHFLILGPVLLTLWPTRLAPAWRLGLLGALGLMCAGILGGGILGGQTAATLTAVSGTVLALGWGALAVRNLWSRAVSCGTGGG